MTDFSSSELYEMESDKDKMEKIYTMIKGELSENIDMDKIARTMYPDLPEDDHELIELFDHLVSKNDWSIFWLVTKWIKKRGLYELEYMKHYERWLHDHIHRWGSCDVFCYRVLNPMVERYPELYDNVLGWSRSSKTYVRRAAPVSLLISGRSFSVDYEIDKVLEISNCLKDYDEEHVQKGVGWLLKYAYLTYPDEVLNYLKENVDKIPRLVFRYALEKVPEDIREEMMTL